MNLESFSFESFLDSLVIGDDKIKSSIYLGEKMSEEAKEVCQNLLNYHFHSSDSSSFLEEKQRHISGKFVLLVLSSSWKENDETPLILTVQGDTPKSVGIMLPFNDLVPLLSNDDSAEIGNLTAIWVLKQITKQ
jgi:hypothetical protein